MYTFMSIFVCSLVITSATLDTDDLQSLFDKKHCIEASLISLTLTKNKENLMLDKDSNTIVETVAIPNNSVAHASRPEKSATSRINELAQYNSIKTEYKLISEEGPPHSRNYKVSLILGDEKYKGTGSSLKKAQQEAAIHALTNTFYQHPPEKLKSEENKAQTPTVVLNNIAMKLGIAVSYYLLNGEEEQEITGYGSVDQAYGKSKSYNPNINASESLRVPLEDPQLVGPFFVRVKVGDSQFKGSGHTIQSARHDAASKAIKDMERQVLLKDHVCLNDESMEECKKKKDSLKSPITQVYEAGQMRNLPVEFTIVQETGKSHQRVFVTQCKLGDFVTEGEGKSKKESKKNAAVKMLENVAQLTQVFHQNAIISGLTNTKKKRKKKNKAIKRNAKTVLQSYGDILSHIWSSEETVESNEMQGENNAKSSKPKGGVRSPKDKLLEIGNKLNIGVQFTDLNAQGDVFYTFTYLDTHPSQVCLGKATSRERSHDIAALHGIKFLNKLGILDKSEFSGFAKKLDLMEGEEYVIDPGTIYPSITDLESD